MVCVETSEGGGKGVERREKKGRGKVSDRGARGERGKKNMEGEVATWLNCFLYCK